MELQSIIVGILGIACLLAYLIQRDKLKHYRERGIKVQGTVIDLVIGGRDHMYYPIVRFTLADGCHVEHKSSSGSNPALFKKAETVELIYIPEEPSEFIVTSKHSEKFYVLFLIIGLLAFGYFVFNLFKYFYTPDV